MQENAANLRHCTKVSILFVIQKTQDTVVAARTAFAGAESTTAIVLAALTMEKILKKCSRSH